MSSFNACCPPPGGQTISFVVCVSACWVTDGTALSTLRAGWGLESGEPNDFSADRVGMIARR